jgi:hypothetical protein
MSIVEPLYGHSSAETAFNVADYPYGSLRCSIKFWLESNSRGFRFCSQTINPKNGRVNAPKKSTYIEHAAAMYLDELNHCVWTGIGIYSKAEEVIQFINDFPLADFSRLNLWCKQKVIYHTHIVKGTIGWKINGVVKERSEFEIEKDQAELVKWEEAVSLLSAISAS